MGNQGGGKYMEKYDFLITYTNKQLLKTKKKFTLIINRKTFNVRNLYLLLEKDWFIITSHVIVPLEENMGQNGIYYNNYLKDAFSPQLVIGPYNNKEMFPWKNDEVFSVDDTRQLMAIELSKFIPSHLLNRDGTISEANLRLVNNVIAECIKCNRHYIESFFDKSEKTIG